MSDDETVINYVELENGSKVGFETKVKSKGTQDLHERITALEARTRVLEALVESMLDALNLR